ncbi:RNA polymerase subunit sigma-70 [Sphingomonas sp. Leaf242]|nr:RNA polymerase subunit sigma-70 [Sphingomonas sp. Leaf242]
MESERFGKLTTRHRDCLRLVYQHRKSAEIAHTLGISPRYVDNQLIEAKNILGASSRFDAACQLAAYESEVDSSHPVEITSSIEPFWPLPVPLPTKGKPTSTLTWQQVLVWGGIIAIVTPIAVTVATMVIVSLTLLLGMKPA